MFNSHIYLCFECDLKVISWQRHSKKTNQSDKKKVKNERAKKDVHIPPGIFHRRHRKREKHTWHAHINVIHKCNRYPFDTSIVFFFSCFMATRKDHGIRSIEYKYTVINRDAIFIWTQFILKQKISVLRLRSPIGFEMQFQNFPSISIDWCAVRCHRYFHFRSFWKHPQHQICIFNLFRNGMWTKIIAVKWKSRYQFVSCDHCVFSLGSFDNFASRASLQLWN